MKHISEYNDEDEDLSLFWTKISTVEKLTTKKKKALEIKATKEGVKQFGAINPSSLPSQPPGGVNPPT